MSIAAALRKRIRLAISLLPWGEDLFLHLNASRLGISYRGAYDSYDSALAARKENRRSAYDDTFNTQIAARVEAGDEDIEQRLQDHDYPLLFWLKQVLREHDQVYEFGGSLGHLFYSVAKLLPVAEGVSWTILELSEAVNSGRSIAEQRGETRLHFLVSDAATQQQSCDLFVTAGTLQYLTKRLPDLVGEFANLPRQVLVHTLPLHHEHSFWTLQRLSDDLEIPYRIESKPELIASMAALGYRCVDDWRQERQVRIPFHPESTVRGYYGFCFDRER